MPISDILCCRCHFYIQCGQEGGTCCSISALSNFISLCCPIKLCWRKTVLYIAIKWLPIHMLLCDVKPGLIFHGWNTSLQHFKESCATFPQFHSLGVRLLCPYINKEIIFLFMLAFPHPYLTSGIWLTQSRSIRSKKVIGAYHIMSWSMFVSLKVPALPSCSQPVFPSFQPISLSSFICPIWSFTVLLSQQPSPLFRPLSACMLHYLQCGNA